jgi:hypothetical protein
MALSINTPQNSIVCHYAECHYADCRYAECRYAECRYAEYHYAECHYAECLCAVTLRRSELETRSNIKAQLVLSYADFTTRCLNQGNNWDICDRTHS